MDEQKCITVNPLHMKWAEDYQAYKESNLTQAEWCDLHGINVNTFRYRRSKLKAIAGEQAQVQEKTPVFAAIPESVMHSAVREKRDHTSECIVLESGEKKITIPAGTDYATIELIMGAFLNV